MLMIGNSPKGFPLRSKTIYERLIWIPDYDIRGQVWRVSADT